MKSGIPGHAWKEKYGHQPLWNKVSRADKNIGKNGE